MIDRIGQMKRSLRKEPFENTEILQIDPRMHGACARGEEDICGAGEIRTAALLEFLPACPATGTPEIVVVQDQGRACLSRKIGDLAAKNRISGQSWILKPNQSARGVALRYGQREGHPDFSGDGLWIVLLA